MNATSTFSTINLTVMTIIFCSLGVANAASVKSLGRTADVVLDGREAKQVVVSCSNRQERTITKFTDEKLWCYNNEFACHINRLKSAERACSLRINTEKSTDESTSISEQQKQIDDETAANETNSDAKRKSLQSELKEIEIEQKILRQKIDSLEAQKNVLLEGIDNP